MRIRLSRSRTFWIVGVTIVVWALLLFSPIGKPRDGVRVVHLGPKIERFERVIIWPISPEPRGWFGGRNGWFPPQFVELRSHGPKFRAYLLDLKSLEESRKVGAFMKASDEIAQGKEPTTAPVKDKAVDVSEAHFRLHWFPIGFSRTLDYMLIVASDNEVEVEVRTNYGR